MSKVEQSNALWDAVANRDARFDGVFFYAVITTGIFCRPGCSSRRPNRDNVTFFGSANQARGAGYRACKRCRPDAPSADGPLDPIVAVCQALADDAGPSTLSALSERVGWSSSHLQKVFKRTLGVTPKQYRDALRITRLKSALRQGDDVASATYSAGFGSSSRLYESANRKLGMTPASYRHGGKGQTIYYAFATYSIGTVLVAQTAAGVCALKFGEPETILAQLTAEFAKATLIESESKTASIVAALDAYFRDGSGLEAIPVDVAMTAFQAAVWRALRSIPAGQTRTYAEVAASIGRPTAYRAVAQACASNPVALVVPCHRVVGKAGVGGYRWGVERKEALLALEGGDGSGDD